MRVIPALSLLLAASSLFAQQAVTPAPKPIEIKVVVVNMFEAGNDTGDVPGEAQYWIEREHLDTVLPFPEGYHDLRMNKDGVLEVRVPIKKAGSEAAKVKVQRVA